MVGVFTIIIILFIIIAIAIIIKFFKHVIKALFLISLLFAIMIAVAGIFVYRDAADFKNNFQSSKNAFMLVDDNDKIITMIVIDNSKNSEILVYDKEQLAKARELYSQGNLDELKKDSYKLVIIKRGILPNVTEQDFTVGDFVMEKSIALAVLDSDQPIDLLAEHYSNKNNVSKEVYKTFLTEFVGSNESLKGNVFGLFLERLFSPAKAPFIIKNIKNENIIIYPETPMFQALKLTPKTITERITSKLSDQNVNI